MVDEIKPEESGKDSVATEPPKAEASKGAVSQSQELEIDTPSTKTSKAKVPKVKSPKVKIAKSSTAKAKTEKAPSAEPATAELAETSEAKASSEEAVKTETAKADSSEESAKPDSEEVKIDVKVQSSERGRRYQARPRKQYSKSTSNSNYERKEGGEYGRGQFDSGRGQYDNRRGYGRGQYKKRIDKIHVYKLVVDYKHPEVLRRFITEKGKILPRRITGTSAKNQRRLVREIKKARFLALIPMG